MPISLGQLDWDTQSNKHSPFWPDTPFVGSSVHSGIRFVIHLNVVVAVPLGSRRRLLYCLRPGLRCLHPFRGLLLIAFLIALALLTVLFVLVDGVNSTVVQLALLAAGPAEDLFEEREAKDLLRDLRILPLYLGREP